jgi:hypothetical protein
MHEGMLKCLAAVLLLLVVACGGSHTTMRQSLDYNQQTVKNSTVIILPPEAVVNTVDFSGKKERMYDFESYMEEKISKALVEVLREHGYHPLRLSRKDIHLRKIGRELSRMRQRYDGELDKLYTKDLWPKEEALAISNDIGRHVVDFQNAPANNILLFSNYIASAKTSGARTAEVLTGVMTAAFFGSARISNDPAEFAKLIVSAVDPVSGKILWCDVFSETKGTFGSFSGSASSHEEADHKKAKFFAEKVLEKLMKIEEDKR